MDLTKRVHIIQRGYIQVYVKIPRQLHLSWYTSLKNPRNDLSVGRHDRSIYQSLSPDSYRS